MSTYEIFFYVNLGVALLTIIHTAAVGVLCKKTAFGMQVGLTGVFLAAFGMLAFIIQMIMRSLGSAYYKVLVFPTLGLFGCVLIDYIVYCFVLGKRSNKKLCYATGVLLILPPIGMALFIRLSFKVSSDSRAQSLLFNGYAYTLAAIVAFASNNGGKFIDSGEEAEFDKLSDKEAFKRVKQLKKNANDAESVYKYAEAVAHYFPDDIKIAVTAMNKAAKQDYPPALFNLGYFHEIGYYYKRDLKKAKEYYIRAKELGDADAAMRLGIVEIESGKEKEGAEIFAKIAESGDKRAIYNYALCHERGIGVEKNEIKAIELYAESIKKGMFVAQQRLFAMALASVGEKKYDNAFRKITSYSFEGEFDHIMGGAIAIKEKRAANAADTFLEAVKCRGKWEGIARLFVGALYLDCGETETDKKNGAAYIKTAIPFVPYAKEIFLTVPVAIRGKYDENKEKKAGAPKPATHSDTKKTTATEKPAEKGAEKPSEAKPDAPKKQ
ncbi:MAG: sel1 repeat family protein [Clostridiales bacterium]|nr:sel1 repeat family protein [Clostridiales bacterium]